MWWPFLSLIRQLGQDWNAGPSPTVMASGLQLQRESPVLSLFGVEREPLPSPAQALKGVLRLLTPLSSSESQLIYIRLPGSPRMYSIPVVSIFHQAQGQRGN